MGGEADRVAAPTAVPMLVATEPRAKDLRPIVRWVEQEGRPSTLGGAVAKKLGIPASDDRDLPVTQKTLLIRSQGVAHAFKLATINGQREMVVVHMTEGRSVLWRVTADGEILRSARIDFVRNGSTPVITNTSELPNDAYLDLFQETVDFLLRKSAER
jgi:hypothetical protein